MFDINELILLHLELDRRGLTLPGHGHFFTVQERSEHTQILTELSQLHRLVTHNSHGSVAGANPKKGATWGQAVNRSYAMCCHRSNTRPRNRHARTDVNRAGLLGGQGQHGVAPARI